MGGGDLNLKKSWHPSTLRNIERVWKAEQKHEAEKQKIEQLQKELAEERAREEIQTFAEDQGVVKKKEEKLDWMYQGPSAMVNRDEYLLGRKIDKTFETMQLTENGKAPEEESTDVTSSVFSSQNLTGTATVDLANKIREDPLFNIMKKEKEQRKNLLTNPVKMKQLQQMLKASLTEKAKKKSKKSKKKKHQENDSDDEAPVKRKKHKKHKSSSSDDDEDDRVSSKESRKISKAKYHQEQSPDPRTSRYDDVREERRHFPTPSHDSRQSDYRSHHSVSQPRKYPHFNKNRDNEDYSERRSNYSNYRDSSHSHRKDVGQPEKERASQRHDYKYNGDSHHRENKSSSSAPKRKLDASERDRLLKEMQENAKWREEQRKKNTARYREEDEREDKVKRIDSSDFVKPMLSKAAGKGSLENRVKQKIFSIQRSSAAMDKNFAKRE